MIRIYVDTSVFGGIFDKEFCEPTKQFFTEIDQGNFTLVTSAIVDAELEPAPKSVRELFLKYSDIAEIATIDRKTLELQQEYIKSGIVTQKSLDDALHVAIATVSECKLIVSWNFKHIVHFDKIPKYNAVNILKGYNQIGIYSPLEIINYENS